MEVPQKLKIEMPYDPSIPLLGLYPKECKSGYNKGSCTPMFIVALFTVAKLWKQPLEPLHQHQKKEILLFVGKWMELENIILSEVNQVQKAKSCMSSLICGI
jgi:hypothetical protein